MDRRPELNRQLDSDTFLKWYWLKEELVRFCKENGIPSTGGKQEVADRVALFLDTGETGGRDLEGGKAKRAGSPRGKSVSVTPDSIIEPDAVCSQALRSFFKEQLGESFSFSVPFQKWLKDNAGKTCGDAVEAYRELKKAGSRGDKEIGHQFEYNTYVRDFFLNNKGRSLSDAVACWKYKKSLPGSNRYEDADLAALQDNEGSEIPVTDYQLIIAQTRSLAEISSDPIPVMANVSALLFNSMPDVNWAGFYTVSDGALLLGPFQGKAACVKIRKGRGVCGTAWAEDRIQVVPDVHAFPGHIACDSESRSEIVLPVHRDGQVAAVLDIDSPVTDRFGKADAEGLALLVRAIEEIIY